MAATVRAQGESLDLPKFTVLSPRVANQDPVATVAMPVSSLRFEPAVDLQARNFAEGQADVAIRGGIFANSSFSVGGLPLYDPQTGHYYAEVPVAPAMLGAPGVAVGAELATRTWNATAGGINYGWRPVQAGGEIAVSAGEFGARRMDLISGYDFGGGWGLDVAAAYSESDGPFANADHEIARYTARLQHLDEGSASNLVVAYQDKFFGWPNLYTPFNSPETEDLQTLLIAGTHRREFAAEEGWLELGAYYRRNDDNYAFNRFSPVGPVPPFKHTTTVAAAGGAARWSLDPDTAIETRLWFLTDDLESTSLRFGRFYSRHHLTGGAYLDHRISAGAGRTIRLKGGFGYDGASEGEGSLNPMAEVSFEQPGATWTRWAAGFAKASQAPSYTAVAGNPNGGLFRGNPDLGRATSDSFDVTGEFASGDWTGSIGAFYRWDNELIDWTFRQGVFGRSASAVDLETYGIEVFARRSVENLDLVLGYSWLGKSADYGSVVADGSFYALNFPNHRLTAAFTWRISDRLELRLDNEVRWQEPNPLRINGKDDAFLSSLGVYWQVPSMSQLQLSLQVDNLWDSEFEEIPAVPAAPRMAAVGARWRW